MPERKKIIPTKFCIAIWVIPIICSIYFIMITVQNNYTKSYFYSELKEMIVFLSPFYIPGVFAVIINSIENRIKIKEMYIKTIRILFCTVASIIVFIPVFYLCFAFLFFIDSISGR